MTRGMKGASAAATKNPQRISAPGCHSVRRLRSSHDGRKWVAMPTVDALGFRLLKRDESLQDFLREPDDVVRQVCRKPHDVVSMPLSDPFEPVAPVPIAATQQRLHLGQLVLKNVRSVRSLRCAVGWGRVAPGDNFVSHLMCFL